MSPDPFSTLGIEPRFDVSRALIEERQRELARALHPDQHAGASEPVRSAALRHLLLVNDACRTLADPVQRAEALLKLAGRAPPAAPSSPLFLLDILQQREALAAARETGNGARVRELREAMEVREVRLTSELGQAFAVRENVALDKLGPLDELRYVQRFLVEAAEIEEALEP